MNDKTQINKRVQARYDFLMEQGNHGHYETMFKCVHEELAEREAQVRAEEREKVAGLVEALQNIAKDTVIVYGWNENHKKVPMGTKQTAMAVYASNVLATYNDNRRG